MTSPLKSTQECPVCASTLSDVKTIVVLHPDESGSYGPCKDTTHWLCHNCALSILFGSKPNCHLCRKDLSLQMTRQYALNKSPGGDEITIAKACHTTVPLRQRVNLLLRRGPVRAFIALYGTGVMLGIQINLTRVIVYSTSQISGLQYKALGLSSYTKLIHLSGIYVSLQAFQTMKPYISRVHTPNINVLDCRKYHALAPILGFCSIYYFISLITLERTHEERITVCIGSVIWYGVITMKVVALRRMLKNMYIISYRC